MIGWKKGEEQSSWAIHPIGVPLFKVRKTWYYALCLAVLWFIEIKPRRSECALCKFFKMRQGEMIPIHLNFYCQIGALLIYVDSFDLVSIDALLNCMRPNCCKTFKAGFFGCFEIKSKTKELINQNTYSPVPIRRHVPINRHNSRHWKSHTPIKRHASRLWKV